MMLNWGYVYRWLLVLMMVSLNIFMLLAQGKGEWIRAGDLMMKQGDFLSAQNCYKEALKSDPEDSRLLIKLADASARSRDYCDAARHYQQAFALNDKTMSADLMLEAALAWKQCGNYEQWESLLEKASSQEENLGKQQRAILIREKESVKKVKDIRKSMADVKITNAGANVNSDFAESGVFLSGDSMLYFSTSSPDAFFSDEFDPEKQKFRLMQASVSSARLSDVRDIGSRINDKAYHNANPVLSRDGETMYFTRCGLGTVSSISCEIWYAKKVRGKWGRARPMGEEVNQAGSSSTHPSLAYIGDDEVMYFASDRDEGKGGWDLYYTILKRGRAVSVTNLGSPVNTPFNEWAPRADGERKLYFSSDGHPGLGGYDLFLAEGGLSQWSEAVNLGPPYNSPVDDLWFIPSQGQRPGYLVSNRVGSMHYAGETCCYDIFQHKSKEAPDIDPQKETDSLIVQYQDMAQELNELLPLNLYFDNDYPDPRSMEDSTNANYASLLADYLGKQQEFINAYSRGRDPRDANAARDSIQSFFSGEVEVATGRLNLLAQILEKRLSEGRTIELVVRGYASPLNSERYNELLASRRIASLNNFFLEYNAGSLVEYMTGSSPRLSVSRVPIGETESSRNVSDDPSDLRNAVYSPAASRERKVSILYGSVEGYTGVQKGETELEVVKKDKLVLPMKPGERKVLRIQILNSGRTAFHLSGSRTNYPDTELVLEKNPLPPGELAEAYLLLRGPLASDLPPLNVYLQGNLPNGEMMIVLEKR